MRKLSIEKTLPKKYALRRSPSPQRVRESPLVQSITSVPQGVYPSLRVGAVNDPLEREADRMAETVMRMPSSASAGSPGGSIQRKSNCTCGGSCVQCSGDTENKNLLRKASGSGNTPSSVPGIVNNVVGSSGQPLNTPTRSFMEQRFGQDFGHVRVHTDSKAADAAQSVQARAFTLGSNVVFNRGEYSPHNSTGKKLLAHELTHVVQQGNDRSLIQRNPFPGESEEHYDLRRRMIRLIPGAVRRIRQNVRRGPGGLFPNEFTENDGRIRYGGPGNTAETLHQRRRRLLDLSNDLEAILGIMRTRRFPASWVQALNDERASIAFSSGQGAYSGMGAALEALLVIYHGYASSRRDPTDSLINEFYIGGSSTVAVPTHSSDTLIDVIVPDPQHPERVVRVGATTSVLSNPATGETIDSDIHRVFRDEQGYYYLRGPAWLGPHRRVNLPGRP